MAVQDPTTKRIWCRSDRYTSGGNSREYIAIHNTANTATAEQEAKNLHNNAGKSSFQYAVDDVDIIQCVHDYDTAWAVGAWAGAVQYIGNNQSISIEVCNPGTEFSDACKKNLRALVLHLMSYYGIPADHVVRHWDCHSGRKQCPKFYSGSNNAAWNALHSYITTGSEAPANPQNPGNPVNNAGLNYRAHVATYGWLDSVHDGQTAGTTGRGIRLEALKITPPEGLELNAKIHVENKGWLTFNGIKKGASSGEGSSSNDPIIGTVGQALRAEALELDVVKNTTGKKLMYRVHLEEYGWTDWVNAGFATGTVGIKHQIEAVQMKLV